MSKQQEFIAEAIGHCLLELTGSCNVRCRHCYAGNLPCTHLNIDRLIEQVFQKNYRLPKNVTLSGGEPLLVDGVIEFANRLRQLGIDLSINTNGTRVDRAMARHLAELRFESIFVSLLGATAATHNRLCQSEGAFERTVRALRWLIEYGAPVIIRVSLMPENVLEIDAINNLASLLGVSKVVFNPAIVHPIDGSQMPAGVELDDTSLTCVLRKLEREPPRPKGMCRAGISNIAIGPDGTVFPCHLIRIPAGNIYQQSLPDIFENAPVFHKFRAIKEENHKDCLACPSWGVSCTRRPCRAYLATGALTTRDPYACREVRLLGEAGAAYVASLDAKIQ